MKLTVYEQEHQEALVHAFQSRERFTLTGAGISADFQAEVLNQAPCWFNPGLVEVNVELTQIGNPTMAGKWTGEGLPPVGTVCEAQAEALRLFSYDPETGVLKWKENQQSRFVGREAGSVNHHGYRRVSFGKTKLHAHQIIWLMVYGSLPECEIDHVNGVRDDNRLNNLRLASQQQNQQNAGVRVDNVLGVKGVRLRPSGRYQARVKLTDGSRAVKTFSTAIEAVSWLAMQRQDSHGEYANTPEQIAVEDRLNAIECMRDLVGDIDQIPTWTDALAKLYDAGYRKV